MIGSDQVSPPSTSTRTRAVELAAAEPGVLPNDVKHAPLAIDGNLRAMSPEPTSSPVSGPVMKMKAELVDEYALGPGFALVRRAEQATLFPLWLLRLSFQNLLKVDERAIREDDDVVADNDPLPRDVDLPGPSST